MNRNQQKARCAILGASGLVGQTFVSLLDNHPWLEPVAYIASDKRNGSSCGDVPWLLPTPEVETYRKARFASMDQLFATPDDITILFSALPTDIAVEMEPKLRDADYHIFTNAGALRHADNVPIMLPDVNPSALESICDQGYPQNGFVVANSNCAVAGLATALAPLKQFGLKQVTVATYQALSGASYPGPSALAMTGNLTPFIPNEEAKIARELPILLGQDLPVAATCIRVPVPYGHTEAVWVDFETAVSLEQVLDAWSGSHSDSPRLPSLPKTPVWYSSDSEFPQPKMAFKGSPAGMQVLVGRAEMTDNRLRFILLVNNLIRGAAGGSIANAELFLNKYESNLCQDLSSN